MTGATTGTESAPRARILVVDDDHGVLRAVQRVLSGAHDVHVTDQSTQAAALAKELRPDLAICDVRMPELDGFDLLEHLRAACPGIDVILMSGSMTGQDAHLVRALRERVFYFILKPFEREVLLTLVDRCLEARRLRAAERRHLDRIESELAAARAFQQAMLPREHGNIAGVTIDACYRPWGEVGGDLFDYLESRDGRVAFIVADVRGHGVPAALLTGTVKSAFRTGIAARATPGVIATQLAHSLASFTADRFVTAFCGLLAPDSGELTYVNAGHPAGQLLTADGEPQTLSSTAPLLSSMFPSDSWPDSTVEIPRGGFLFLHTDGLTDAPRFSGDTRAIGQLLAGTGTEPTGRGILDTVLAEVSDDFEHGRVSDDVTMMVVRRGC